MAGAVMLTKPMSVVEIVAQAQAFEFNPNIAIKYWLRTADTLLREAQIYEQEESDQQAYLLLMRYVTLVVEKLPGHPNAREPINKKALGTTIKNIPAVVEKLEILKPRIELRYKTWQAALARHRETPAYYESNIGSQSKKSLNFAGSDPAVAGSTRTLAAAEHSDLAVRLAHKEIRRRDAARRTTRQAGISEEDEHRRRRAHVWDDWEAKLSVDGVREDEDLRRQIQDTRQRMDQPHDIVPEAARKRLTKVNRSSSKPVVPSKATEYRYPSVSKSQFEYSTTDSASQINKVPQPPVPTKQALFGSGEYAGLPPARPEKLPHYDTGESTPSLAEEAPSFTFQPSAYLENGSPLRTVFLPPSLRERFLTIAESNTRANLETCGVLCGTLISNALFISRLVIPEQESTSDTCETVNESALFDFCDSEDLMVLGWIHTHPSQTCFMSSRDVHTHCGYQVMMPESIAIVCAPTKDPSWGVFRLTDPPGMKSVLNCRQTGLFHPHAEQNIYTDALRPGHVFEAKGLEFQVVDLRPGH